MKFMMHDDIMVADKVCTGGSKFLAGFKSPLSAKVYEKCLAHGMEFEGFVIPDEFSIDNLFDEKDELDAAITALLDNKCDVVLCNDVFGKIRRQAPANGLIYIHPSYGTVSRFGLMQGIASMDQIGILCRNLEDGIEVLNVISGHDASDGTSLPAESYSYEAKADKAVKAVADSKIFPVDVEADDIEMKYADCFSQIFYILGSAEICNNTNRYDGVKFGYRAEDVNGINDLYVKSRTESFGRDLQLASLAGCMVLSKEYYDDLYNKSMQIRRLVRDYYADVLDNADVIALPAKLEGKTKYEQMAIYALAPLCGFASISMLYNNSATQFICKRNGENKMFALAQEGLK